jgi:hypothetical protein
MILTAATSYMERKKQEINLLPTLKIEAANSSETV